MELCCMSRGCTYVANFAFIVCTIGAVFENMCVPQECSMTKLEHKTSLQSSSVRWGESFFMNEVHRSRVYQIKKWASWITCYDGQTWHVNVFKQLALNASSSSSSYRNSPVHEAQRLVSRTKKPQFLFNGDWSLLTCWRFAIWCNCWTTEQVIPVRFAELISHLVDFRFNFRKNLIAMAQRSVRTGATLGLLTICLA
jgi:hypothetical protein